MEVRTGKAAISQAGVTPISLQTALFCFGRLAGFSPSDHKVIPGDGEPAPERLAVTKLIEIARRQQLQAKLIQSGWHELRALLSTAPVLLVLRNGNMVLALENSSGPVEEIIVSDPLYCDGEEFFLTRDALEAAWNGIALAVKRLPADARSSTEGSFSTARAATISVMILPLLLYPIQASKDDSATALITPSAATDMHHEAATGRETATPASVLSAVFPIDALGDILTQQPAQDSNRQFEKLSALAAKLSKTSSQRQTDSAAATRHSERGKLNLTILRGTSSAR